MVVGVGGGGGGGLLVVLLMEEEVVVMVVVVEEGCRRLLLLAGAARFSSWVCLSAAISEKTVTISQKLTRSTKQHGEW